MAIVPSGVPAWLRTNDHATYGGDTQKTDFHGQGAVDARTDVAAKQFVRMCADLASVQRTAPFATLTYTCVDTPTPGDPTNNAYKGMPQGGADPVGTRNGDGDVSIDWGGTYIDAYGIEGPLVITGADATLHGAAAGAPVVSLVSDTSVRVRCFTDAGGAVANAKVTLIVYTGGT